MSTIEERVKSTIAQQLRHPVEELRPEANIINDLGADSLDEVEIVMALEEEFDFEISDEEAEKWHTVADVIAYITAATTSAATA